MDLQRESHPWTEGPHGPWGNEPDAPGLRRHLLKLPDFKQHHAHYPDPNKSPARVREKTRVRVLQSRQAAHAAEFRGRKVWSVNFTPEPSPKTAKQQPEVSEHAGTRGGSSRGVLPEGIGTEWTAACQGGRGCVAEGTPNPFDGDPSLTKLWELWQCDPM